MISLKDFFSFKKNRFFWLNLIAMIVVVIGAVWGTLHWLDNYTRHGQSVTVPNVKGLPLQAAENEINKLGLNAIAIDSNYYHYHGYQVKPEKAVFLEREEIFQ